MSMQYKNVALPSLPKHTVTEQNVGMITFYSKYIEFKPKITYFKAGLRMHDVSTFILHYLWVTKNKTLLQGLDSIV